MQMLYIALVYTDSRHIIIIYIILAEEPGLGCPGSISEFSERHFLTRGAKYSRREARFGFNQ